LTADLQANDIGSIIRFTIKELGSALDISQASIKKIFLQKKDKTIVVVDALFTLDGTDGKMEYITSGSDFLSPPGKWKGQGYVEMDGGSWHTSIVDIEVGSNLA
jgi:hypothetical protein